ncbi:MAG TPA: glycosyltransferase family 9 protein [Burkholderiales bacterium]
MPPEAGRGKRREAEIFGLIDTGFDALSRRDLDSAVRSAEKILAIEANQVDALYLKGQIAHQQERLDIAQDFYEQAILAKPDFVDPYLRLITALFISFQQHEALQVWQLAMQHVKPSLEQLVELCTPMVNDFPREVRAVLKPALDPANTNSRVWTMYQQVLHRLRVEGPEYDGFLRQMRELFPGTMELDAAETAALAYANRTEEAIVQYHRMAEKHPQLVFFTAELARTYRNIGRYEEAETLAQKLSEAFPDQADFPFMWSEIKLCRGEILPGLTLNESRFKRDTGFNWKYLPMPNWNGEPLEGKRILIIEEQGFGDCIMFGRYLPELMRRGANVRYVCRPQIYPLFAGQPALRGAEVFIQSPSLQLPNDMDYYVATMSVARCLGLDAARAGEGASYLQADPARVARWRGEIGRDGRPLVGIVWAANLNTSFGNEKSIPQALVPQILDRPDIAFVSLQVPSSLDDPHRGLYAHTPEISDFNDTMALIDCLDAVVSVDTSVAHLAASMGKRTIVMSKFAPDWRWEGGADGRPYWYPEVEVIRQQSLRDWSGALRLLSERLTRIALTA